MNLETKIIWKTSSWACVTIRHVLHLSGKEKGDNKWFFNHCIISLCTSYICPHACPFFFFFNSRFLILPSVVHFAAKFLHYNFVPFSWLSVQYEIEHMLWTTEMLLCYDRTQTITNGTRCWCNIKQFDKASNQNFDWKRMCTLLNKSKFIMTANSEFDILLL